MTASKGTQARYNDLVRSAIQLMDAPYTVLGVVQRIKGRYFETVPEADYVRIEMALEDLGYTEVPYIRLNGTQEKGFVEVQIPQEYDYPPSESQKDVIRKAIRELGVPTNAHVIVGHILKSPEGESYKRYDLETHIQKMYGNGELKYAAYERNVDAGDMLYGRSKTKLFLYVPGDEDKLPGYVQTLRAAEQAERQRAEAEEAQRQAQRQAEEAAREARHQAEQQRRQEEQRAFREAMDKITPAFVLQLVAAQERPSFKDLLALASANLNISEVDIREKLMETLNTLGREGQLENMGGFYYLKHKAVLPEGEEPLAVTQVEPVVKYPQRNKAPEKPNTFVEGWRIDEAIKDVLRQNGSTSENPVVWDEKMIGQIRQKLGENVESTTVELRLTYMVDRYEIERTLVWDMVDSGHYVGERSRLAYCVPDELERQPRARGDLYPRWPNGRGGR